MRSPTTISPRSGAASGTSTERRRWRVVHPSGAIVSRSGSPTVQSLTRTGDAGCARRGGSPPGSPRWPPCRRIVDGELVVLAIGYGDDLRDGAALERAIASENVEARVLSGAAGAVGVALPCRSDASDEEIRHVVLAAVKATHADASAALNPEVLFQLAAMQAIEQGVAGLTARARALNGSAQQVLGCLVRW